MKRYTFYALLMLSFLALIVLGGCSKNSPNAPDDKMDPIDQEYGGYTTADEVPEASLVVDFEEQDETVVDGISEDPAMNALLDSNKIKVYFVRVTWGMLKWDSSATVATDWSGTASVNKGTLAVLKKIRFERGEDFIKLRTNRQTVEWISRTMPHFDGLYFAIFDNDTSQSSIEGEFTFSTGPYSNTFTFSELDSMELIETVDNLGNQISFNSFSKHVTPFAGGFLEGRWIKDTPKGGHFWGRWVDNKGFNAGFLKGIWGENRFGQRVFYGKYTDFSGRFKGLLVGNWEYTDENSGKGAFYGNWINASFFAIGKIKGSFKTGEPGDGHGYFRGRWTRKY